MLLNLGRLLMLCVWGFLLANLVHPYPKPLTYFINVALIFMILMHGLQLVLLRTTQTKDAPPIDRVTQASVSVRGVRTGRLAEEKLPTQEIIPGGRDARRLLPGCEADKARALHLQLASGALVQLMIFRLFKLHFDVAGTVKRVKQHLVAHLFPGDHFPLP